MGLKSSKYLSREAILLSLVDALDSPQDNLSACCGVKLMILVVQRRKKCLTIQCQMINEKTCFKGNEICPLQRSFMWEQLALLNPSPTRLPVIRWQSFTQHLSKRAATLERSITRCLFHILMQKLEEKVHLPMFQRCLK
jgi:hypothetical protein